MNDFVVALEDVSGITSLEELSPNIRRWLSMAINKTAPHTRKESADLMKRQLNFPGNYLDPASGRLKVTRTASPGDLEAIITGRQRATSLARFVTSQTKGSIGVSVKRGRVTTFQHAFIMNLRSGTGDSGALANKGLAVRVPKGTVPDKAYKPVKLSDGLFLLYGPSVDQAFKSVREDVSPDALNYLEGEFDRLFRASI